MPNIIERGRAHVLAARRVRGWTFDLAGYAMHAAPTMDPGTQQREMIGNLHMGPLTVQPVAGRFSASPASNYSGETPPAQVIVARPGLDQADPVAGVSSAGAGMPPILPSARRTPPVT